MAAKSETLQRRKQQLVHDAIWEAAIDLFIEKGFDEATVEDIARAAGVSRRSFFRYFASKRDLMALRVLLYGRTVSSAILECPRSCSLVEVMERSTHKVAREVAAQPRTRQVFKIAECSATAKEALLSSLPAVEEQVTEAFKSRLKGGSKDPMKPRLLAALTLSILNVAVESWCRNEHEDISMIINRAFSTLSQLVVS